MPTAAYLNVTLSMPRYCNSLDGYTISRAVPMPVNSKLLNILSNPSALVSLILGHRILSNKVRQSRRPELVSARSLLHGTAEVSQGVRSLPTGSLPRRTQSYILVLYRSFVLPDQPISGRPRCILPCHSPQSLYLGGLVRPWYPGMFAMFM